MKFLLSIAIVGIFSLGGIFSLCTGVISSPEPAIGNNLGHVSSYNEGGSCDIIVVTVEGNKYLIVNGNSKLAVCPLIK